MAKRNITGCPRVGAVIGPMEGIVLSMFDRTTNMVRPWADAGWLCYCVDSRHPAGETREGNIVRVGADIMKWIPPRYRVKIVFGFPPCTTLAVSGARWFAEKGLGALTEGLQLFGRAVEIAEFITAPYMIENPVSVVSSHYRRPDYKFDPCDYAGYLEKADQKSEAYTKKTCLWCGNGFIMPKPRRVAAVLGSKMFKLPPSTDRADIRSATPIGFAQAVYEANCASNYCEGYAHQRPT